MAWPWAGTCTAPPGPHRHRGRNRGRSGHCHEGRGRRAGGRCSRAHRRCEAARRRHHRVGGDDPRREAHREMRGRAVLAGGVAVFGHSASPFRRYPFPELVSELILFGARRTVVGSPATRGGSAPGHCGAFGIAIHPANWPAKLGGRARRVHCPPEAHGLSSRWTLSIGSDTSTCAAVHSALLCPRRSQRVVLDAPDEIRAQRLLQSPTC